jgi:hypothetical protein
MFLFIIYLFLNVSFSFFFSFFFKLFHPVSQFSFLTHYSSSSSSSFSRGMLGRKVGRKLRKERDDELARVENIRYSATLLQAWVRGVFDRYVCLCMCMSV